MENYIFDSIKRYFSLLKSYGYCNYDDVNKLLAAIFILELHNPNSKYYSYLSKRDKRDLRRALNAIAGRSYILPFPRYSECECPDYGESVDLDALVVKVIGSGTSANAEDVLIVKVIGTASSTEMQDTLVVRTIK